MQQNLQANKVFMDSITYKLQILPQKFKIIKTPIHLYGELVKTEEGANYLSQTRDVYQFKQEIMSPDTPLIKKRAALWAIGHIGSIKCNQITQEAEKLCQEVIQEAEIMRELVKLAESAEILSIRGTCIYIMGLMCKSFQGQHDIKYFNWVSSQSSGISVCLPKDPQVLFKVDNYTYKGDLAQRDDVWAKVQKLNQVLPLISNFQYRNKLFYTIYCNEKEAEIVKLIGNLINGVTEIQALNDLKKLIEKEKPQFVNPKIFEHVIVLLSLYKFKPKARKFIFNMFEDLIFNDLMLPESVIDL